MNSPHQPADPALDAFDPDNTVFPLRQIVPAKRKRSNTVTSKASQNAHRHVSPFQASVVPNANGFGEPNINIETADDDIHCICGFTYDDGFSIACDECGKWSHAGCFGIEQNAVPDEWKCWVCVPRAVDRERAVRLQRARKKQMEMVQAGLGMDGAGLGLGNGLTSGGGAVGGGPGVHGGGPGRKRRDRKTSVSVPPPTPTTSHNHAHAHLNGIAVDHEDEHIDIDNDDWRTSYIPITSDIIPHKSTSDKLRQHARGWRGVTALSPSMSPEPGSSRRTRVLPVRSDREDIVSSVRPPNYALHTTTPIPQTELVMPYRSTIVSSSTYLSDPLNGYAHLGMPQPHVHLIPPPLSVALDARMTGNEARFARSGCKPNAVLRPVLCRNSSSSSSKKRRRQDHKNSSHAGSSQSPHHQQPPPIHQYSSSPNPHPNPHVHRHRHPLYDHPLEPNSTSTSNSGTDVPSSDEDDTTIQFGIFALRDLKAKEEVVLGWEWDDGAVVHELPALIEMGMGFGVERRDGPSRMTPHYLQRVRLQMENIVHSLESNFTTCACGKDVRGCAVQLLKQFAGYDFHQPEFVTGPPLLSRPRASPSDPIHSATTNATRMPYSQSPIPHSPPPSASSGNSTAPPSNILHYPPLRHDPVHSGPARIRRSLGVDLGPLIGVERGFRTRVKGGYYSGGMDGVEVLGEVGEAEAMVQDGDVLPRSFRRARTYDAKDPDNSMQEKEPSLPELRIHEATSHSSKGKERARDPELNVDEMVNHRHRGPSPPPSPSSRFYKHRHSVRQPEPATSLGRASTSNSASKVETREVEVSDEERLPPRMRKKWMRQAVQELRKEADRHTKYVMPSGDANMSLEDGASDGINSETQSSDQTQMPPPPVPPPRPVDSKASAWNQKLTLPHEGRIMSSWTRDDLMSPSVPFSNMSLQSPSIVQNAGFAFRPSSPSPSPLAGLPSLELSVLRKVVDLKTVVEEDTVMQESEVAVDDSNDTDTDAYVRVIRAWSALAEDVMDVEPDPIKDSTIGEASQSVLEESGSQPVSETRFSSSPKQSESQLPSVITVSPSLDQKSMVTESPVTVPAAVSVPSPSTMLDSIADLTVVNPHHPAQSLIMADQASSSSPGIIKASIPTDTSVNPDEPALPSVLASPPEKPKVRYSMADYMRRKKKQREEEAAKAGHVTDTLTPQNAELNTVNGNVAPIVGVVDSGAESKSEPPNGVTMEMGPEEGAAINSELQDGGSKNSTMLQDDDEQAQAAVDGTLPPDSTTSVLVDQGQAYLPSADAKMPDEARSISLNVEAESTPDLKLSFAATSHSHVPLEPESDVEFRGQVGSPLLKPQSDDVILSTANVEEPPPRLPDDQPGDKEDGEIPYVLPASHPPPRPRTPPKYPRSFRAQSPVHRTPTPSFPRRPSTPPIQNSLKGSASSSRPLPNAPRALREHPSYVPSTTRAPAYAGSSYVPRGPLAERDRVQDRFDRERRRDWPVSRGRGRGGGSSWAR